MNVYGKITILDQKRVKNKVWCRCECGVEKWIKIFSLKNGDTRSCGCLRKELMQKEASKRFRGTSSKAFSDYSGRRIGMITVLKRIKLEEKDTWYLLKCDCGTEFETMLSSLRRSRYEKCRCGFEGHPLKQTLQRMIDRCTNPKNLDFKWYGEKGIEVFSEWKAFPIKFIEWSLKNGWREGLTIDRIDSEKGYFPENCKWITRSENAKKAADERWARNSLE